MITIEGLGGKGTVWCAVRFAKGMLTGNSQTDSYAADYNDFITASPTAIYLPPVGGSTIWYDCSTSPYGPSLTKVKVGTLFGATTTPDQPNPCKHSTIVGSLLATGSDLQGIPAWSTPRAQAINGRYYYHPSGNLATFVQGKASKVVNNVASAINRFGSYERNTAEQNLSYNNAMFTGFASQIGSSNPLHTFGAQYGMWLCNRVSRLIGKFASTTLYKTECSHVSARVWKETRWKEYHQDTAQTPSMPISEDTGLGYVISVTKRQRVVTMRSIQSVTAVQFNGLYDVEETVEYWGNNQNTPYNLYEGKVSSSYSFTAPILVLEPGSAIGTDLLLDKLNDYCQLAIERATQLYRCNDATTVRSSAIAAVPGLDSNWIENLAQVKGTAEIIVPLIDAWKAVKYGDILAGKRALVGAYLSYMYVISPGIRDAKDLKNNLGTVSRSITKFRLSNERRRGMLYKSQPVCNAIADLAYFCTINLQLKDNTFALIGNALEKLGLNPSAANIWDLIPFSFVVDWFIKIGPVLSRLDAYENSVILRDVKSRVETFKVLWPLTETEVREFVGNRFSVAVPLKYSWYDRRILTGVGSFDPYAGQSFNGLSVSQMTQGGALLSSYKK